VLITPEPTRHPKKERGVVAGAVAEGGSASARTTTKTFHGTLFLLIIISHADQTGPLVHQFYMSSQLPSDVGMWYMVYGVW